MPIFHDKFVQDEGLGQNYVSIEKEKCIICIHGSLYYFSYNTTSLGSDLEHHRKYIHP